MGPNSHLPLFRRTWEISGPPLCDILISSLYFEDRCWMSGAFPFLIGEDFSDCPMVEKKFFPSDPFAKLFLIMTRAGSFRPFLHACPLMVPLPRSFVTPYLIVFPNLFFVASFPRPFPSPLWKMPTSLAFMQRPQALSFLFLI